METSPGVPPVVALLNKMTLAAVHAVVDTAIAPGLPDIFPVTPQEALEPVAMSSLFPAVAKERFPFVAMMLPRVAVIVVAALREVPACKVVVEAIVPGAINVVGMLKVIVPEVPVVVIWLAVPARVILPALGPMAPPESPVSVEMSLDPPELRTDHVAVPPLKEASP